MGSRCTWDRLPGNVEVFDASPKAVEDLWGKVKGRRVMFPDDTWCNLASFEKALSESLVLTTGAALLRISRVLPGVRCEVHGFVLDGAMSRYTEVFKDCLRWVFESQRVRRIECKAPVREGL